MIKPVNGHVLIDPLKHDTFITNETATYQEIGLVINADEKLLDMEVHIGDKVYFDSWLAAKFPKEDDGYFWLVKWEDVRAIENAEPKQIPE